MNGEAVGREHQLLGVSVVKTINKISWARLAYLDGSPSEGDFPLSSADIFVPGSAVEVLAGALEEPLSLFRGIVTGQSIKVRERSAPQLVIECRHAAFKLTVGRKSACFFDQKDSDTLAALLGAAGIDADVEDTSVAVAQQVQYRCSDWDFVLARAEANGKVVLTNDGGVVIKAAPARGESVATLAFGATLLELDAEVDARLQFSAVKTQTWDPAEQQIVVKEAADPGIDGAGNFAPSALARVAALEAADLRHAALDETEAQAWADAVWRKSRASKVSGRAKCEGIGSVNPGDFVTLGGLGARYVGDVLVSGVRHEHGRSRGWETHLQFGSLDEWVSERPGSSAPSAGALLPAVSGLSIGVVTSNEDPAGEHRVRIRLPLVDNESEGVWARVASPDAGDECGFFFRPELGDEVVVGFLEDDPRRAVILGMLHSSAKAAPLAGSDDNHEKVYQTRSKMKLFFDDDKRVMRLETPAGNRIELSEDAGAIRIADQNGNEIELDASGIRIESSKAVRIAAAGDLELEATGTLRGSSSSLALEGSSSAALTSSSTTTIKGGLVKIN